MWLSVSMNFCKAKVHATGPQNAPPLGVFCAPLKALCYDSKLLSIYEYGH